jgi:glycosyltransferase involved in cell wall biosynthesis
MESRMNPASFLITVHNGEAFLENCINSTLRQTIEEIETVVVLDGCTDASADIATAMAENDSRVKVHVMPRIGRGAALNVAVARSHGAFLAVLDADDFTHPRRIEHNLEAFQSLPENIAVVGSDVEVLASEEGEFPSASTLSAFASTPLPELADLQCADVTSRLRRRSPIAHSTAMLRRDAVLEVGGYNVRRTSNFDYDLFVRLAIHGFRIAKIPAPLVAVRYWAGSGFVGQGGRIYRLNSMAVQVQALRGIPGPIRDSAELLVKGGKLLVPAKYALRARTRQ